MSEGTRYFVWPVADDRALAIAMLLLVALFAGAVALELYRRRRDRTLRLQAEWRGVRELCEERELLPEDWKLLRAILAQYAAAHPYAAVTQRAVFDECVSRYIQALSVSGDDAALVDRGVRLRDVRNSLGLDYVPFGRRIHTTRSLQPGQLLWAAPAAGPPGQWFHFEVDEVNEATFSMVLVGSDARPDFPQNATLKCRLWREEDARYLFEARVFRKAGENGVWVLRHAESLTRNQSRAYFRLRVEQAVPVSVLSASRTGDYTGVYEREATTELRGRLTSLSGGGLAVVFSQPMPKQVLLRIPITIPSGDGTLVVIVQPVAVQALSGGRCLVRGAFVAMDEDTRERITHYIFSKQKLPASGDHDDHG